MAILKHLSSKSADYDRVVEYLMYQHERLSNKPLKDEDGHLVMRENFRIDAIDAHVSTFAAECKQLNRAYHKNQNYSEIKSHHYIISFDPKDAIEGKITVDDAQRIGMDFARKSFPGHQAIVCTHDDGENHSGNVHVHIIINSLRKRNVERQPYMDQRSDSLAGCKHHLTNKYLAYLKQEVMNICHREKLHQVELLSPAKKRVAEKEYWAEARGKRTHGSAFETRKETLRKAIEKCAKEAKSEKDFSRLLREKYHITLKVSRGRYGYLMPDREKPIRGRMLGTDYTEEFLRPLFEENARKKSAQKNVEGENLSITSNKHSESANRTNKKTKRVEESILPSEFFMPTKIRLVKDLQSSAISSASRSYDRKVKIANLKRMAETIMYVENHGYEDRDAINSAYDAMRRNTNASRTTLKRSEDSIKALNEQIHYTGQYLANKGVYQAYMKAKNKGRFRSEHESEIILYEAARKYLKTHADEGTLPSSAYIKSAPGKFVPLDRLKAKRSELIEEQKKLRTKYHSARNAEKELYIIKKNVDAILNEPGLSVNRRRHKAETLE